MNQLRLFHLGRYRDVVAVALHAVELAGDPVFTGAGEIVPGIYYASSPPSHA
ncbi:MAG: hypothetical protein KKG47_03235 [Proteobacteria bacterium]|nr:hypothetical protein [Pseudomonadota bacterium]MBU1738908.1 hypothetical protein [Pseudomonadota bacterium]